MVIDVSNIISSVSNLLKFRIIQVEIKLEITVSTTSSAVSEIASPNQVNIQILRYKGPISSKISPSWDFEMEARETSTRINRARLENFITLKKYLIIIIPPKSFK